MGLLLRSRNTGRALVVVAITNLLFVLTAGWRFQLPNQAGQWAQIAVILPTLLGCFVPLMTASAHGDLEFLSGRPLAPYRLVHVLTLLATCTAGLVVVTARMPVGYFDTASVIRNAALLVGIGLCLAPWLGPGLAWIPAAAYSVLAIATPTPSPTPRWNLLLQPGGTAAPVTMAAGTLIAGLIITAWRGPRLSKMARPR